LDTHALYPRCKHRGIAIKIKHKINLPPNVTIKLNVTPSLFTVTGTDPENDTLQYIFFTSSDNVKWSPEGKGNWRTLVGGKWTPNTNKHGQIYVKVCVRDGFHNNQTICNTSYCYVPEGDSSPTQGQFPNKSAGTSTDKSAGTSTDKSAGTSVEETPKHIPGTTEIAKTTLNYVKNIPKM
jgi:hypothetical protein